MPFTAHRPTRVSWRKKCPVMLQDQQHRWLTDQPLKVEDYLSRLPDLASNPDAKLQLVVGEFRSRQLLLIGLLRPDLEFRNHEK